MTFEKTLILDFISVILLAREEISKKTMNPSEVRLWGVLFLFVDRWLKPVG